MYQDLHYIALTLSDIDPVYAVRTLWDIIVGSTVWEPGLGVGATGISCVRAVVSCVL
jgi:hypothetical protein